MNPENATELQQRLRTMGHIHNKGGKIIFDSSEPLTSLLESLSSKDLDRLGASYLKISDIQKEAKLGKEIIRTEENKKELNKEFKQKWVDREEARSKSPKTPER